MAFSKNALKVLERRYLSKDETGAVIETPEEMLRRVARHVAGADVRYDPAADTEALAGEFYRVMDAGEFMPNSPTLMNAGKPLGQLSACFVLPVGDSIEEIFDAVKNAALIHKSGGGTGFSFSRLRGQGASVRSTGGIASGPVSFMKVFNAATEAVKQGGTRRGANMGILRVDHPDILEFIECKREDGVITNFNISVGITEAFMEAVEADGTYELLDPHTRKVAGVLRAREVFGLMVEMAWRNGEPGIVFLDRMNAGNPAPTLGEIEATNPCGEQPLLPYESCNLGSVNLGRMLAEDADGVRIDYDKLGRTVDLAVHFLDNVIDVNRYPLDQIAKMTLATRKIGLGVMGFADMLFQLGIPYNSRQGFDAADAVMGFINRRAHAMSEQLAESRGVFEAYEQSVFAAQGMKMRNATCTTIAPTGTISILCDAASGIEPLFALSFVRNVMDHDELPQVDPCFARVAKERGFYSDALMRRIAKEGTLAHIPEVPDDVKRIFVTAHDIPPEDHIRMQAAFQKHTDNAVSKTVNFPYEATREDVAAAFNQAFQLGCKGVTIYRDGSRRDQVLYMGDQKQEKEGKPARLGPRPRPEITQGITEKVVIGCGNLYITVNYDDEGICEVFTNLGRAGGCPSQSEATSRLISTALRSGMQVEAIIEQLKGIRCHATLRQRGSNKNIKVLSCPDAIGRVLEKTVALQKQNGNGNANIGKQAITPVADEEAYDIASVPAGTACPECGATLHHEGGCMICRGCGYSRCG